MSSRVGLRVVSYQPEEVEEVEEGEERLKGGRWRGAGVVVVGEGAGRVGWDFWRWGRRARAREVILGMSRLLWLLILVVFVVESGLPRVSRGGIRRCVGGD